jgi:hypothetical protein
MKAKKIVLGLTLLSLSLTSCKNEKEEVAKDKVDAYVAYVDSLEHIPLIDASDNWKTIEASYQMKISEVEAALMDVKKNQMTEDKITDGKVRYETLKTKVEIENEKAAASKAVNWKNGLRDRLFGIGRIGDDMNFDWVNAGNIHSVYQQFVHTVEKNKDSYTREDWDEIKLLYEALDSRKNTVEKEGLSSSDNAKIAGLKVKFSTMYTIKRMSAKAKENTESKE